MQMRNQFIYDGSSDREDYRDETTTESYYSSSEQEQGDDDSGKNYEKENESKDSFVKEKKVEIAPVNFSSIMKNYFKLCFMHHNHNAPPNFKPSLRAPEKINATHKNN